MRLSWLSLAVFAALVASGAAFAAGVCSDGTPYGKCSTANPGNYCTGALESPSLQIYTQLCRCEAVPGWVQEGEGDNARCVQAKCTDGTEAGKCSATKPKMCAGGVLVDNATKCGCPSGKRISANGLACEPIPCNDSGVSVPEGTCSPKTSGKMCIGGVLVDKASQCPCKSGLQREGEICVTVCSDGTKAGECSAAKPKECTLSGTGVGVLVDNAAKCGCPTGKTAVGKQCIETGLGSIGGAEVLGAGGQPANESQAAGGAGPLSCCCLPAALISLAGGFAFFGKRGQ